MWGKRPHGHLEPVFLGPACLSVSPAGPPSSLIWPVGGAVVTDRTVVRGLRWGKFEEGMQRLGLQGVCLEPWSPCSELLPVLPPSNLKPAVGDLRAGRPVSYCLRGDLWWFCLRPQYQTLAYWVP